MILIMQPLNLGFEIFYTLMFLKIDFQHFYILKKEKILK